MKSRLLVCVALALAGFHSIAVPHTCAQGSTESQNTLEVIASNGADRERHLFSVNGMVPMLMVRQNQTVSVTLQFPTTAAGTPVAFTPLDGGRIAGDGNGVVSPTGRMLFTFNPGAMFGRYRVMVYTPTERHLLEFYVVDPNHPPRQRRLGSNN